MAFILTGFWSHTSKVSGVATDEGSLRYLFASSLTTALQRLTHASALVSIRWHARYIPLRRDFTVLCMFALTSMSDRNLVAHPVQQIPWYTLVTSRTLTRIVVHPLFM
jgi:hypothetical protein